MGYVAQDVYIFSGSVADNIAYGRPDATRDEVREAAVAAAAADFIDALPDGFDSHLGERGVNLSGGQRQRLALARALLRDRAVLVHDDGHLLALLAEPAQRLGDPHGVGQLGKRTAHVRWGERLSPDQELLEACQSRDLLVDDGVDVRRRESAGRERAWHNRRRT